MTAHESIQSLRERMSESIIGQQQLIDRLVLLADGNLLLEGLLGLAKTRAIKSLASNLNCGLSRIQFTPDLLPSFLYLKPLLFFHVLQTQFHYLK